MAETSTKQLPPLRTYARDLETERQRRGMPSTPTPPVMSALPPKPPQSKTPAVPAAPAPAPQTTTPEKPAPPEHLATTPPAPKRASEAVLKTREDELKKDSGLRPTTIPPFHTLKTATRRTAAPVAATAAESDRDTITIIDDQSGATVITDTKRNRFSLGRSLFASLRAWWQKRTQERKARNTPKYVVPETDRRKGVIQRATSHTGRQITGDPAQLRDLVRERQVNPPPVIAKPETTWTPHTETIFELLPVPEADEHFTNVTTTARYSSDTPAAQRPTPIKATSVAVPPVTPAPVTEVTKPTLPAPVQTEPKPQPEEEIVSVPAPEPDTKPVLVARAPAQPRSFRFDTNTLAVGIVALVVVVGLGNLGLRAYLTPAPVTEVTEPTLPLTMPLRTLLVVDDTRDVLMGALTTAQTEATLPLQLFDLQRNAVPITPRTILTLLDENLGNSLSGEVTALYFGWHNRSTAFVVLSVTDRTRVWGHLLQNERALGSALSPLLRTSADRSFTDERINQYDIRSHRADDNTEELAYGFVNDNTLVITRDKATFLLIAGLATPPR
jgi:hypothetical protein